MDDSTNNTLETIGKKPSAELLEEVKKNRDELIQKASEIKQEVERLNYKHINVFVEWLMREKLRERNPRSLKIFKTIFLIICFLISGYLVIGIILIYYFLSQPPDIESLGLMDRFQPIKNMLGLGLPIWIIIPTVYWLVVDLNHLAVFLPLPLADKVISLKGRQEEISEKIDIQGRKKGLRMGKNVFWLRPSKLFFYLLPLAIPPFLPELFSNKEYVFTLCLILAVSFYVMLLFLTPIWTLLENIRIKRLIKRAPQEILLKYDELFNTLDKFKLLGQKAREEGTPIAF